MREKRRENCKHKCPIPFMLVENDPECSYIKCTLDGVIHQKWDGCEDWEEEPCGK